jgi:hypothetical protein
LAKRKHGPGPETIGELVQRMQKLERTVDEFMARVMAETKARYEAMHHRDDLSSRGAETAKRPFPWASQAQIEAQADRAGLLSSDEISARLGVSRQTTNRWREEGKLLGFVIAKRGYLYPREQINERGQPLPGIDTIIECFAGDHWAAWRFLESELPELDGQTGFDAISGGKIDSILNVIAARDHGSFT